nr:MAG TPA: hypothetical protein [Caudoviricetes sp.]
MRIINRYATKEVIIDSNGFFLILGYGYFQRTK